MSCFFLSIASGADAAADQNKPDETPISDAFAAIPDTGLDPTILNSRVALTNEFKDQAFGARKDTVTLNLAYAFGDPVRRDWTVQLDLPAVRYVAGNQRGSESSGGLGDIEARIGHVLLGQGLFRCAVGGEVEFDTAGGPPAGDGVFRLSPIAGFAFQPARIFKFQTLVQFDQSLRTSTGVPEEQKIEFKPALNFALPANSYFYTEFEEDWSLRPPGDFSATAKFEVGHAFGSRSEWVLSVRCELPLTQSTDDCTLTASCTYNFK